MKLDLAQLEFINPLLRDLALAVEERFGEKTITSLYRIGDTGVHGMLPLRGLDFRCTSQIHGKEVETWVNDIWSYDSSRPEKKCCLFHNVGNGWHLHLQVHPKTVRRK